MPMGTPLIHIPVEPEERRLSDGGVAEFKTLCGQWRQWQHLLGNYRPRSTGRPVDEDNIEPTCPRCIKKRG